MKVIEITLSKGRKVNIGNYESRDYFVSVKVDPFSVPTDYYGETIKDYFAKIEADIEAEIARDRLRDQDVE